MSSGRRTPVFSLLLALLLLGAAGYGVFVLLSEALRLFGLLDKTVEAAIIAASATVLASAIAIALGKIYELQLHIQKENREKKIPVYEDLLSFIGRFLTVANTDRPVTEDEARTFMQSSNQRFMVWASDNVILAWVKWRRHLTNSSAVLAKSKETIFLYEDLILAIRRDLGHRNKGLSSGDVLSLFINDVHTMLPRQR